MFNTGGVNFNQKRPWWFLGGTIHVFVCDHRFKTKCHHIYFGIMIQSVRTQSYHKNKFVFEAQLRYLSSPTGYDLKTARDFLGLEKSHRGIDHAKTRRLLQQKSIHPYGRHDLNLQHRECECQLILTMMRAPWCQAETSSLTHQYCHVAAFVPNWVPSIWLGGVTVSWLSMVPKFMANGDM